MYPPISSDSVRTSHLLTFHLKTLQVRNYYFFNDLFRRDWDRWENKSFLTWLVTLNEIFNETIYWNGDSRQVKFVKRENRKFWLDRFTAFSFWPHISLLLEFPIFEPTAREISETYVRYNTHSYSCCDWVTALSLWCKKFTRDMLRTKRQHT